MVDGLERDLGDRVTFLRVDIQSDAGARIAERVQVTSVPGFVAFDREGTLLLRTKGPRGAGELRAVLERALE